MVQLTVIFSEITHRIQKVHNKRSQQTLFYRMLLLQVERWISLLYDLLEIVKKHPELLQTILILDI